MHPELAAALQPVLRDLRAEAAPKPIIRDEPSSDMPDVAEVMVFGADGFGQGIHVGLGNDPLDQIVAVADQLQEWAVEALWSAGRSATWPSCPRHPNRHPLQAALVDGRPAWRCPRDEGIVAVVGELGIAEHR